MKTDNLFRSTKGMIVLAAVLSLIMITGGLAFGQVDMSLEAGAGDVKNVILLVGDGMGYAHTSNARLVKGEKLNMDLIKSAGSITTQSANSLVTDSAAAGTAMATGFKTNNGMISVNPEGEVLKTVLEAARVKGKKTGLVSTAKITDATPAAFASHVPDRSDEITIAAQILETGSEVILGGGKSYFLPVQAGGKRTDGRDLTAEAIGDGYTYVTTGEELNAVQDGKVLGLFHDSNMLFDIDRNLSRQPSLAEMTVKAISIMDNKNEGFFLMVEGGRIDHTAHANDPAALYRDVLAFDEAVRVAIDYANTNRHTMVIVVADHETGGLILGTGGEDGETDMGILNNVTKSAGYMAILIGRGTPIADVLRDYAGIDDLSADEVAGIQEAANKGDAIANVISSRAGVKFNSYGHTGVTVPVMAAGKYEQALTGLVDNTDIAKVIAEAMKLEL